MVEMNSIPWSPVLRYATPIPMNRTPVLTVALQHKSVSFVLWYATPLLMNRTPISTVPQNGTPRDTVHLHRRPPPASTGYHRPPPASTGSCSSSLHHALLHRLLFNHPSTGTPSPSTIHPALHGVVLFIQRQRHGVLHPPPPLTVHPNSPPTTLTVHPIDWLQLAVVAKESLDRVQLTAIDRSLGFSNA